MRLAPVSTPGPFQLGDIPLSILLLIPFHWRYEDMPQSLRTPFLLQSLRTPLWFDGWLIDWVDIACTSFPFFLKKNHLRFGLHFCFIQWMIPMPIGRLEVGRVWLVFSGKYQFLKCADFEAKTGCADLETFPRTVNSICFICTLRFHCRPKSAQPLTYQWPLSRFVNLIWTSDCGNFIRLLALFWIIKFRFFFRFFDFFLRSSLCMKIENYTKTSAVCYF